MNAVPAPETHIEKPNPSQLFELAGSCIELGKAEQNRLSMARKSKISELGSRRNAVVFMTDFLTPPDQTWHDFIFDPARSLSRQLFGRIYIARDRAWSMQIKQIGKVFVGDKVVEKYHDVHRFKWMGSEVLEASRIVQFVDLEEDYGESYQPPSLDPSMFSADFINTVNQYQVVSSGDTQQLMTDIRVFGEGLKQESDARDAFRALGAGNGD